MRSSIDSVCNLANSLQELLQGKSVMEPEKEVEKVLAIGRRFGEAVGLGEAEIGDLELLIRVHDVGVAWAPAQTIFKQEALVPDEAAEMRQHVSIGSEVISSTPGLQHLSIVVLHHHERWDGSGYP